MAAIPQQGTYLGTTLVGFTSLAAGLVLREGHTVIGILGAIVGLGLLVYSGIGLYRIKTLALTR
ncbi:MAG: hypothetical protein LAN83_15295 [Acidobacteriia bacterium]|nr:hypothetical protein [Terriglobia bacterium]